MNTQKFLFYIQDQPITPPRFLKDRRTRADMEAEPTEVRIPAEQTLTVGFALVRRLEPKAPRALRTFIFGELIAGEVVMTHYIETMRPTTSGAEAANNDVFRAIPGANIVEVFVTEAVRAIPEFVIAPREEAHLPRRHLLVGDIWRGSIWTHSVREVPVRQERPVRTRAVRYGY